MKRIKTAAISLGVAWALAGCAPPHYSVGVAHGPTHVTYAQRHHDAKENDYLVDCQVDAQGNRSNCVIIPLPAPPEE